MPRTSNKKQGAPANSVHIRSPLKKTRFATGTNPSVAVRIPSNAVGGRRTNKLTTTATKGGTEIIGKFTDKDGKPGYPVPFVDFLNDPRNATLVLEKAKVHDTFNLRDPNDPEEELRGPKTKSGFNPPYTCFISIFDDEQAAKNTAELRERWGKGICIINNSKAVQVGHYGNAPGTTKTTNQLEWAGDTTPAGPNNCNAPHLSDFMTIGKLMDMLGEMYKNNDTDERLSDEEIVKDNAIMEKYFSPDLRDRVEKLYTPVARPDGSMPGPEDPDRYGAVNLPDLGLDE